MGDVAQRVGATLQRAAPSWGVGPVPPEHRSLGGLDLGVLWFDLSVGLLVMVTGALLVPALGLPRALLAIVVGSLIGCVPLALVALAGEREGVPTMVLLRPVLGERGSFAPSALNVIQLLGWTAVEFWVMGEVANIASARLFGFESRVFWLALVALACTVLAVGGPVLVVRRWLERLGIYVLLATAAWMTVEVLRAGDLGAIWDVPDEGGLPFWLAVDLVIVMPVSWLPLAADYNRFARPGSRGALGTYVGYLAGNVWFYALGALLVLAASAGADAVGIGASVVALAGGGLVLLALLVGESDNAFADIYSAAVSTQNIVPEAPQRVLALVIGAVAFVIALVFSIERYELFLLLIGSVFVPLAALFLAWYYVRRRGRYPDGEPFRSPAWRWSSFVPWGAGFIVYHWSAPTGPGGWVDAVRSTFEGLGLAFPLLDSRLGATLPSFAIAFGLALVMPRHITRGWRAPGEVGRPRAGSRRDRRSRS